MWHFSTPLFFTSSAAAVFFSSPFLYNSTSCTAALLLAGRAVFLPFFRPGRPSF
jgi:hypothetical protein